jgi:hypothetical protein
MPYSPLNIRDAYAKGKTLNDVWQDPFFQAVRQWEYDYVDEGRSTIAPCPNRDHHDELERLLLRYEPEPTDSNAAETLVDPEYTRRLVAYNRRFQSITDPIWKERYLDRKTPEDKRFAALPDIPVVTAAETTEQPGRAEKPGRAEELEQVRESETTSVAV